MSPLYVSMAGLILALGCLLLTVITQGRRITLQERRFVDAVASTDSQIMALAIALAALSEVTESHITEIAKLQERGMSSFL